MKPICFSELLGNEEIKQRLSRMISKRMMGHALLFSGAEGIGKSSFAWALAAHLMKEYDPEKEHCRKIATGHHPDVHVYHPEGKLGLHSLQALRQFTDEVYLPPYEASWKIFIIHDADRMLSYSANALLKTFEEPPSRTVIILISRSRGSLLPTILSRCSIFHFRPISSLLIKNFLKTHYSLEESMCHSIARQAQGSLGAAIKLITHGDGARLSLLHLLAQGPLGDYRSLQQGIQAIAGQLEIAKKRVEKGAKEELYQFSVDQLSLQEQHALEKEVEGLIALATAHEAEALFDSILSWYSDLQLLLLGGSSSYLANLDFYSQLEQAVQRGDFKPLDQVSQAVEKAYLALQRSTPLSLCLETLFLTLDHV